MFELFKKKKKKSLPQLIDLNDNPLVPGDMVTSYRYELGTCKVVEEDGIFFYQSIESGIKINWLKMIDAATEKQKVEKILNADKTS